MQEHGEVDKNLSSTGIRKSLRARATSLKHKYTTSNHGKVGTNKARSRRFLLKKQPNKLVRASPLIRLEHSVCDGSIRYNVGDIVSVMDVDSGVYYAQIRALAVDAFGENSCILTWLVPTTESSTDTFEPENFVIGMEEDILRDLSCCSLVCRCPSDYFRPIASPYSIQSCRL